MSARIPAATSQTLQVSDYFATGIAPPFFVLTWTKGGVDETVSSPSREVFTLMQPDFTRAMAYQGVLLRYNSETRASTGVLDETETFFDARVEYTAPMQDRWVPIVYVFGPDDDLDVYTLDADATLLTVHQNIGIGGDGSHSTDPTALQLGFYDATIDGYLHVFALWTGRLPDQAEIDALLAGALPSDYPTGLYASYVIDADWGTGAITDSSANARDLTPPTAWVYDADAPDLAVEVAPATIVSAPATLTEDIDYAFEVSDNSVEAADSVRVNGQTVAVVREADGVTLTISAGPRQLQAYGDSAALELVAADATVLDSATVTYAPRPAITAYATVAGYDPADGDSDFDGADPAVVNDDTQWQLRDPDGVISGSYPNDGRPDYATLGTYYLDLYYRATDETTDTSRAVTVTESDAVASIATAPAQLVRNGHGYVITGSGFGATQGTGAVALQKGDGTPIAQTIVSWSDTRIEFDAQFDASAIDGFTRTLRVTGDNGAVASRTGVALRHPQVTMTVEDALTETAIAGETSIDWWAREDRAAAPVDSGATATTDTAGTMVIALPSTDRGPGDTVIVDAKLDDGRYGVFEATVE